MVTKTNPKAAKYVYRAEPDELTLQTIFIDHSEQLIELCWTSMDRKNKFSKESEQILLAQR